MALQEAPEIDNELLVVDRSDIKEPGTIFMAARCDLPDTGHSPYIYVLFDSLAVWSRGVWRASELDPGEPIKEPSYNGTVYTLPDICQYISVTQKIDR